MAENNSALPVLPVLPVLFCVLILLALVYLYDVASLRQIKFWAIISGLISAPFSTKYLAILMSLIIQVVPHMLAIE